MKSNDQDAIQLLLRDVDDQLRVVAPGVSFLYGRNGQEHEFVATARGDRNLIPIVVALIESAPIVDGWKFTKFRPPIGNDNAQITIKDLSLSVADISFQGFDLGEDGLGITLYPNGMTEERRDLFERASVTLMDHTIGEYDSMVLIDSLRVDPLSDLPEGSKTRPLSTLRVFLHKVRGLDDA